MVLPDLPSAARCSRKEPTSASNGPASSSFGCGGRRCGTAIVLLSSPGSGTASLSGMRLLRGGEIRKGYCSRDIENHSLPAVSRESEGDRASEEVVRDRIELSTFRFSVRGVWSMGCADCDPFWFLLLAICKHSGRQTATAICARKCWAEGPISHFSRR